MALDSAHALRVASFALLALTPLIACATKDGTAAPSETGSTTNDTGSTTEESETDVEPGSSSASSSGFEGCALLEEGIAFDRLPVLQGEDVTFSAVPCDVTADGFSCAFEPDAPAELVDVDALLEPFAALPWAEGDTVLLAGSSPFSSAYEAYLSVRSPDDDVLAVVVWNLKGTVEPFTLTLEDIGCGGANEDLPPLEATYTLGDQSLSLLGSGSGALGEYTVYQEYAADYAFASSGELGDATSHAIVRTPS